MIVGIKIMPREVILDTEGRAIENSMKSNGYSIHSVRAGKYLELELPAKDIASARAEAVVMLKEGGLYNPLIEKYEIFIT